MQKLIQWRFIENDKKVMVYISILKQLHLC